MSSRGVVIAGAGVVGAAALGGAAYGAYLLTSGTSTGARFLTRRPAVIDESALRKWVTWDNKEVRYADTTGAPEPIWWPRARAAGARKPAALRIARPAGTHEVPVVSPTRTPLVPEGFSALRPSVVRFFQAVKRALVAGGLGSWDARIIAQLWANETGWDRGNFGHNAGNVKSQGQVYAESWDTLRATKRVHVVTPEARAVQVFVDFIGSCDGYLAFDSFGDYARYFGRVIATRYAAAVPAAQRGGLEGAVAFARVLGAGGYSPESADGRERQMRAFWSRWQSIVGGAAAWEALK